jgi:hypothetical protein
MMNCLHQRFPECGAFRFPNFFDNFVFECDGETFFPTRGHGLGMANALTSMMQIIIENMVMKRTDLHPVWSGITTMMQRSSSPIAQMSGRTQRQTEKSVAVLG